MDAVMFPVVAILFVLAFANRWRKLWLGIVVAILFGACMMIAEVPIDPVFQRMVFGFGAIGAAVSPAWRETGAFLGPSIERFLARAPLPEQARWWQEAGLRHVRSRVMSLGAGVVWSGTKA
jgi:hypothetical protein